jgi:hypothetical protein
MHSTINDSVICQIICTCGCKTSTLKSHLKSYRHRVMQRIKDRELVKETAQNENDEIIKDHFLKYEQRVRKPLPLKKPKPPEYYNISCTIFFD